LLEEDRARRIEFRAGESVQHLVGAWGDLRRADHEGARERGRVLPYPDVVLLVGEAKVGRDGIESPGARAFDEKTHAEQIEQPEVWRRPDDEERRLGQDLVGTGKRYAHRGHPRRVEARDVLCEASRIDVLAIAGDVDAVHHARLGRGAGDDAETRRWDVGS